MNAPAAPPPVRLEHISAGYGDRLALDDVDLTIEPGSLLAVIGPNGAGKSTLLKVMAGLLPIRSGRASILGTPRDAPRGAWPTFHRPRPSTGTSR
jgi:ABC-type multidrug transport system ATPase subunit